MPARGAPSLLRAGAATLGLAFAVAVGACAGDPVDSAEDDPFRAVAIGLCGELIDSRVHAVWSEGMDASLRVLELAIGGGRPEPSEIEPLTAQAVRLPLASVLLWLTPWTWSAVPAMRRAGRGPLVTIGALSVITAASSVLFVAGLKYAGVAVGAVLSSTAPVFALPLGVLFLGERVSMMTVAGVLLALAGIIVLQL